MPARPRITRLITGGIPEIHGDKFRPDDYILEETFNQGLVSDVWENLSNPPCIISGLVVTQGAGSTINISSGYAVIKDTQNPTINLHDFDGTSLASAVTIPTKYVLVYFPGVTGFSDFTPTTDGTTVHYVTAQIKEIAVTGGERQNAATPATAYDFIVVNSLEISVSTTSPTADDFQLDSFTAVAGPTYTLSGTDREEDAVLKPLNDKFQLASDLVTFLGSSNNLGIDLSQLSGDRTLSLPDRDHQIGGVEDWATATVYYENELVRNGSLYYRCTSTGDGETATGSFATDLGNGWWELASTEIIDNLTSMSTTAALSANQGRILNGLINANLPEGYIYGFELEYDTAGTIIVNSGSAKSDDNTFNLELASALEKNVLSAFVAGNTNGGKDSGMTTIAGDDCHVFVIGDSSGTNPTDVLVSNSYSSPTLPPGYDKKRWVGALMFKITNTIPNFYSSKGGRRIVYVSPTLDNSQTGQNFSSTAGTMTPAVPLGLRLTVDLNLSFLPDTNTANEWYVFNTDITDQAPGLTTAPGYTTRLADNASAHLDTSRFTFEVASDGLLKVRTRVSANTSYYLTTLAYEYER